MIAHHQGAVDMSEVLIWQGSNPQVVAMARRTIDEQRRHIAHLEAMSRGEAMPAASAPAGPTGPAATAAPIAARRQRPVLVPQERLGSGARLRKLPPLAGQRSAAKLLRARLPGCPHRPARRSIAPRDTADTLDTGWGRRGHRAAIRSNTSAVVANLL
jgi:hypothetical protein